MPADWYCEINGVKIGPVTSVELKQMAQSGKLQPSHPVWKEGMQRTVQASTVKGLFDGAPSSAAADTARQLAAAVAPADDLPEFEMVEEETKGEELIEFEMVDESSEKKPDPPKKKKPEREKEEEKEEAPPETVAEVAIIYREGHPDLRGPLAGQLTLESTGMRFQFEDEDEFRISFEKVENVLEPVKGDFPPAMKKKALGKKLGGKAGKLAAGMLGSWLGGDAGKAVEKVGGAASKMAEDSGDLGKPPRNRIAVFARIRKERCKLLFDTSGADRDEMNEEAKVLYRQIQKTRNKFSSAEDGSININIAVNQTGEKEDKEGKESAHEEGGGHAAAAHASGGKSFRVMIGGQVRGPYSLEEVRGLLKSGKLGGNAMIGVETWLPASTFGGLAGAGGGHGGGAHAGKGEGAEEIEELEEQDDEFGDFEEVEEEEETPSSPLDGDGALPVDDEFNIG